MGLPYYLVLFKREIANTLLSQGKYDEYKELCSFLSDFIKAETSNFIISPDLKHAINLILSGGGRI